MKRRLFVPIVFAGVALASGVASANPQYWRDNGLLLEVSADPRDGRDFVQVDATRANQLELVALNDTVTLRGITLRFADGHTMSHRTSAIVPGQPLVLDLPHNGGTITGVELDYGNPANRRYDRTPARLQIVPRMTRNFDRGSYYSQYNQPAYSGGVVVQQPRINGRRYQVRPRPAAATLQGGWTIQGSFRF